MEACSAVALYCIPVVTVHPKANVRYLILVLVLFYPRCFPWSGKPGLLLFFNAPRSSHFVPQTPLLCRIINQLPRLTAICSWSSFFTSITTLLLLVGVIVVVSTLRCPPADRPRPSDRTNNQLPAIPVVTSINYQHFKLDSITRSSIFDC